MAKQRQVRVEQKSALAAMSQGMGEIQPVEPLLPAESLRHAAEDLARDDAGVAAGAHERAVRHGPHGRRGVVRGGADRAA